MTWFQYYFLVVDFSTKEGNEARLLPMPRGLSVCVAWAAALRVSSAYIFPSVAGQRLCPALVAHQACLWYVTMGTTS